MNTLIEKIENDKLFKFVKENLSLLILIPSLFGGLRQFLVLLYLSPTLIQYFSFSQIAIDGLETIIQGIYVVLISSLLYKIFLKNNNSNFYGIFTVFAAGLFQISFIYYVQGELFSTTVYNLTTFKAYSVKFCTLTMVSFIFSSVYDLNSKIKKKSLFLDIYIGIVVLYVMYIIILFKPFQLNVKNIDNSLSIIRKQYSKNAELVYYNDTYLIYVLNPNDELDKRKFFVKKFDTLFEDKGENKTNK